MTARNYAAQVYARVVTGNAGSFRHHLSVLLTALASAFTTLADPAPLLTQTNGLACHTAEYAPRSLAWEALAAPAGVKAVHPHPSRSETLFVTATDGLLRSDDFAATWRKLPLAGLDASAAVTTLAFRPCEPETFCFGTRAHGVWLSRDGGRTAKNIGAIAAGLASDAVIDLVFAADDPFQQTLLAAHGKAAPGLSRGDLDSGAWAPLATAYAVYRVLTCNPESHDVYLFAAESSDPETVGLYYAPVAANSWQRLLSDTLLTDGAWMPVRRALCATTLDKGVIRADGRGGVVEQLGGGDLEWFSADATWGVTAEQEQLALYQPSTRGLIGTPDGLSEATDLSRDLYRGSFVAEGAAIRANAGGTRFYGAINGALWVGRADGPLRVDTVSVSPSALTFSESALDDRHWRACEEAIRECVAEDRFGPLAADLAAQLHTLNGAVPGDPVAVQAHVTAPAGANAVVTADLSRFGLSAETPLAPGSNGLYTTSFALSADRITRRWKEWRRTWPGPIPITVSARTPNTLPAGGVGVLALYPRPESFTFWNEGNELSSQEVSGQVTHECARASRLAAAGQHVLRLTTGPGAWRIQLGLSYRQYNVTGFHALTFLIRSAGPADEEMLVHLADSPEDTPSTATRSVPILAGKHVAGGRILPDAYRRVCIPIAELTQDDTTFRPELLGWIGLSGQSAVQRTYLIDNIRFIATPADMEQAGQD